MTEKLRERCRKELEEDGVLSVDTMISVETAGYRIDDITLEFLGLREEVEE